MGQDKALLPFLGQPLIQRVIGRVRHLADEVLVTTNQPEGYQFLELPLIPDRIPDRGALGGLYTALDAAHFPLVAVVACDMPFVSPQLLSAEIDRLTDPALAAAIRALPAAQSRSMRSTAARPACPRSRLQSWQTSGGWMRGIRAQPFISWIPQRRASATLKGAPFGT